MTEIPTITLVSGNGSTTRQMTPEEVLEWQSWGAAPVEPPALPNLQPYQFHAMVALTGYGPDILLAIDADPDPLFAAAARAKYLYSTYYKREDPFVVALATAVGLSPEQLDALWANASEF